MIKKLLVLIIICIHSTLLVHAEPTKCEPQGTDDEELFAKKVCLASHQFGLNPNLVHSYGACGVDIFITENEANILKSNKKLLIKTTISLTKWVKANCNKFNMSTISIVGEKSIAKGTMLGKNEPKIEIK